jgi:uncharacterized protein (UPF0276 family)
VVSGTMKTTGFGLGLRTEHYPDFLAHPQPVDWLEVLSDNYMVPGGKPLFMLDQILERYPMVMHGVSLSIGAVAGPDQAYLQKLKVLERRINPLWISDHLCWTGVHGRQLHDLMPLPFTEEALAVLVRNVRQVQDVLGRPLVLENVSSYVEFACSEMQEWEFMNALSDETECQFLLDVNNVYVSAFNHGYSALDFIHAMKPGRVIQIHLAGHSDHGTHLIDTHDQPVPEGVWSLYQQTIAHLGFVPTMIERDANIPPLADLLAELDLVRRMVARASGVCSNGGER